MLKYIDLTHTLSENISVSPFDDKIVFQQVKTLEKDQYNDTQIITTMHIGTHIDAPSHMFPNQKKINEYPVEKFIGQGILLNFKNQRQIIMKQDFNDLNFTEKIVLIYTNQDKIFNNNEYYENHPVITEELCDFLIEKQIKAIGLDFFSPDYFPSVIHKKFLENDILIVENLCNLDLLIDQTNFEIFILPIKIATEGAFIRAVAKINHP